MVVAYEILVSAQGPLALGFWVWGLGVWGLGLTTSPKTINQSPNYKFLGLSLSTSLVTRLELATLLMIDSELISL